MAIVVDSKLDVGLLPPLGPGQRSNAFFKLASSKRESFIDSLASLVPVLNWLVLLDQVVRGYPLMKCMV